MFVYNLRNWKPFLANYKANELCKVFVSSAKWGTIQIPVIHLSYRLVHSNRYACAVKVGLNLDLVGHNLKIHCQHCVYILDLNFVWPTTRNMPTSTFCLSHSAIYQQRVFYKVQGDLKVTLLKQKQNVIWGVHSFVYYTLKPCDIQIVYEKLF